ncbi:MAG: non-homologous end-joining DNA ligase [Actinomycetota bacterium]|nr:non-homologous end-joining DNA ligase [Actinomycetota bacterium]
MPSAAVVLEIPGLDDEVRHVRISSPDRVMWPASGASKAVTKADLARYVVAVGDALLRAVGDRPVTLQRYPDGVQGQEFYSKNPPRGVPAWARSVPVVYPSGRSHLQLVIDEVATAVWTIQMNTVTLHPWPVRTGNLDNPDELRIDLDPQPGRPFSDVIEAASALGELSRELGFAPFVKTSGNRGLHVFSRIKPTHEFLEVRHGVIGVARELERRKPELVTTAWWKEQRGDKIFIDFNQACRDRTIASAYSVRPQPAAPVSMPVSWQQLPQVKPADYTVWTVPEMLAADGDAWAPMDDAAGDVGAAIALWDMDIAERGLGEMNFPPDYPKMPNEPPRVQPSRKNAANWDN